MTDEIEAQKAEYREALKESDRLYLAWKNSAEGKAWSASQDHIEELREALEDVEKCENCLEIVFDDEPQYQTSDGDPLCEICSPSFADLLREPSGFIGTDDEPLTPEQAQEMVDQHLKSGGNVSDSMAKVPAGATA